ncbi:uncharacterized protein STEHIDRAFT_161516 [Stereum hirsutum FP-91666 SS1]|uniref:uncharacterized protein n=1 Tax=Stereum hirsutum (strain FP-91666) TaxID=721885 RepID=UPI00044495B2|nr:uncharacterized protein STEHIDRAFT_161516 [Stereum hirsutum FP-91666 SS1]EIM82171.1 hypothetical protein STEHIDRAFT_161516 [Stereum hirsutum FP-91666 SS1]
MGPTDPPPFPNRHERYYFNDGSLVLQCEGVLYNVHPCLLSACSALFQDMLSLPQSGRNQQPGELEPTAGSSNTHPVAITSMKADFDNLLLYIYDSYLQKNPSLEYLLSILKMSHFYIIEDGLQYAFNALEKHTGLTAQLRMHLALQYNHHQWIEPVFRGLITRPANKFTLDDVAQIGTEAYFVVTHTQARLDHLIRSMACWPPTVLHGLSCEDQEACDEMWENTWWGGFTKQLFHPDRPANLFDALETLHDIYIPGFNAVCKMKTLDKLMENSPLERVEVIIRAGIRALGGFRKSGE